MGDSPTVDGKGFLPPFGHANRPFKKLIKAASEINELLSGMVRSRQINQLSKASETESEIGPVEMSDSYEKPASVKTMAVIGNEFRRLRKELRMIRWSNLLFWFNLSRLSGKDYRSSIKRKKKELFKDLKGLRSEHERTLLNIEKRLLRVQKLQASLEGDLSWDQLGVMADIFQSQSMKEKGASGLEGVGLTKLSRDVESLERITGDGSRTFESFIHTRAFLTRRPFEKEKTSDPERPQTSAREELRKDLRVCSRYMKLFDASLVLIEERTGRNYYKKHLEEPYKKVLNKLYDLDLKENVESKEYEELLGMFKIPLTPLSEFLLFQLENKLEKEDLASKSKKGRIEQKIQEIMTFMKWELVYPKVGEPINDEECEIAGAGDGVGDHKGIVVEVVKRGYRKTNGGEVIKKAKALIRTSN